jgi:hypothetical protein
VTAQELAVKLTALLERGEIDPDAEVVTEGCDCSGLAKDIGPLAVYRRGQKEPTNDPSVAYISREDD